MTTKPKIKPEPERFHPDDICTLDGDVCDAARGVQKGHRPYCHHGPNNPGGAGPCPFQVED